MTAEEKIVSELKNKFSGIPLDIKSPRPRRVFAQAPERDFPALLEFAARGLGFVQLCTITGLDEGDRLGFIYHLTQPESGIILNLKTAVPKNNPVLKSVTPYFPNAEIYERELVDLFGAKVEGLPAGNRYPLTDDWPQGEYPLRKDWPAAGAAEKEGESHA
jgi:Ni,Fe-hydrogenase III component G